VKRFHLVSGAVLAMAFLLTGQYMDKVHLHLTDMPDGPRMMYRTRHIFVMFMALLNLGMGTYVKPRQEIGRRVLQWSSSVLIVVAACLFIAGFFYEPGLAHLRTPLSHWGANSVVAGVLLHVLAQV
jgi:hypothetical protein